MLATTVPFFHVGGLSSVLAVLLVGGCLVFPDGGAGVAVGVGWGGFDSKSAIHSMSTITTEEGRGEGYNVNLLVLVPAMLHSLLEDSTTTNERPPPPSSSHSSLSPSISTPISTTRFPNVRLLIIGGQSLTMEQLQRSNQTFPNAKIVQTYACTEAGSSITFGTLSDPTTTTTINQLYTSATRTNTTISTSITTESMDVVKRNDDRSTVNNSSTSSNPSRSDETRPHGVYAGYPPPHIKIQIFLLNAQKKNIMLREDGGVAIAPFYTVGIIATRGLHVMTSYWHRGGARRKIQRQDDKRTKDSSTTNITTTATTNPDDGWFLTNDLGYLAQNGALYFCGRLNQVIRTGGESVYPPEVERVLLRHPRVEACAVFGMSHGRWGECVCAAIIERKTIMSAPKIPMEVGVGGGFELGDLARNDIRSFCQEDGAISGFKCPWRVFVLEELPRNSAGKVLTHRLARMCSELRVDMEDGCNGIASGTTTTTSTRFHSRL